MYIGKKVKELRKQQGMKLIDLAAKSGIQIATLSRIEHLKMTGTLESHMKIAQALGVDVTLLYSEIVPETEIVQQEVPTDVFIHSEKSSYEILTTKLMSRKMMPIMLKIEPDGSTTAEQGRPGTERFIYVLQGTIEITLNNKVYTLKKGHTLQFDGSLPHYFINKGTTTVKALVVSTPILL